MQSKQLQLAVVIISAFGQSISGIFLSSWNATWEDAYTSCSRMGYNLLVDINRLYQMQSCMNVPKTVWLGRQGFIANWKALSKKSTISKIYICGKGSITLDCTGGTIQIEDVKVLKRTICTQINFACDLDRIRRQCSNFERCNVYLEGSCALEVQYTCKVNVTVDSWKHNCSAYDCSGKSATIKSVHCSDNLSCECEHIYYQRPMSWLACEKVCEKQNSTIKQICNTTKESRTWSDVRRVAIHYYKNNTLQNASISTEDFQYCSAFENGSTIYASCLSRYQFICIPDNYSCQTTPKPTTEATTLQKPTTTSLLTSSLKQTTTTASFTTPLQTTSHSTVITTMVNKSQQNEKYTKTIPAALIAVTCVSVIACLVFLIGFIILCRKRIKANEPSPQATEGPGITAQRQQDTNTYDKLMNRKSTHVYQDIKGDNLPEKSTVTGTTEQPQSSVDPLSDQLYIEIVDVSTEDYFILESKKNNDNVKKNAEPSNDGREIYYNVESLG